MFSGLETPAELDLSVETLLARFDKGSWVDGNCSAYPAVTKP